MSPSKDFSSGEDWSASQRKYLLRSFEFQAFSHSLGPFLPLTHHQDFQTPAPAAHQIDLRTRV
jgi:hypothetical protein